MLSRLRASGLSNVPLGDLVAQLGVAAAADQLDLVGHLGGHGDKSSVGPSDDRTVKFCCLATASGVSGEHGCGVVPPSVA